MAFELAFVLAGLILAVGYVGDYLFRKMNLPDVLILVGMGILLGPLFGIVDASLLKPVSNIFAILALVIILFEGGLDLDLYKVLKQSHRALFLALLGFTFTILVSITFFHLILHYTLNESILLGAIMGGTAASVVIPLISRFKNVNSETKIIVTIEAAFGDVFAIVLGLTFLQVFTGVFSGSLSEIGSAILSQFSVGAVIGAIAGILWLKFLGSVRDWPYNNVLTLGILLFLYSIVEGVKGSGAIFALVFGLILGNGEAVSEMLKIKELAKIEEMMRSFMAEMSFFMRTFFFVYIGLLFTFALPEAILIGIIFSILIFIARIGAVKIAVIKNERLKRDFWPLVMMVPRGLAAAVFVEILSSYSFPSASFFGNIVTTVIVFTMIICSIGSSLVKRYLDSLHKEN